MTTPISRTFQTQRNGVILLLVLAMLAMFAMIIATFMVVSSQQYKQADSVQRLDRYTHSPKDDLNSALFEVLVGSNNTASVIRAYSLAATMYGNAEAYYNFTPSVDEYRGFVLPSGYSTVTDYPELHQFALDFDDDPSRWKLMATSGSVFTVRHPGTLKWHSARIVKAAYDGGYYVTVRDFPGISDPSIFEDEPFYINPPAYSGMGVGYVHLDDTDPGFWERYAEARLTDGDIDVPFAMQLNPNASLDFRDALANFAWQQNVDYTAPDAASPFLAWYDEKQSVMIPSYHRPALVAAYCDGTNPDTLRKVVMRPLPFDHPYFDGSNPPLGGAMIPLPQLRDRLADPNGLYLDVDTDGDGIPDSVWVDVGLPVRTDINGRTYKPLVAVKCIDLDGRLNVNAHGNFAHWINDLNGEQLGSGFGPAGIDPARGFKAALGDDTIVNELIGELFRNRYLGAQEQLDTAVPRNATLGITNSVLMQTNAWEPGTSTTSLSNYFGSLFDPWDQGLLYFDPLGNRYNNYLNGTPTPSSIDFRPTFVAWLQPADFASNPYLFDPSRRTPYDYPFTLAELEAVLRQNDIDKDVLPGRLREILGFGRDADGRPTEPDVLKVAAYNITAMSNDVPVPGPALADQGYANLYELIRSCVEKESDRLGTTVNIDAITLQLIEYLPEEIKQGGKINLNKLVEDPTMFLDAGLTPGDYENALYERMKMARGLYIILMSLSYNKLYGVPNPAYDPLDPTSFRYIVEPYIEPSFLQADKVRELYDDPLTRDLAFRVCRELAATRLAQWAVNVVDFTDVDAIMTPFIFDANPFDGTCWGIRDPNDAWGLYSGALNEFACVSTHDNYRLLWGMERPDLLLTETMASHNRNVADTSLGGKAIREDDLSYFDGPDANGRWQFNDAAPENIRTKYSNVPAGSGYDQIRMPQGPAFLELYCAADPNRPYFPQELYTGNQLDVSRVNAFGSRVWQVVVGESNYSRYPSTDREASRHTRSHMKNSIMHRLYSYGPLFSFQPDSPDLLGMATPTDLQQEPIAPDRIVWFTTIKPSDISLIGPDSERIYYNRTGPVGLAPNEYLVVGPRMETHLTSQRYGVGSVYGNVTGCPKIDLTDLVDSAAGIGVPKFMVAAAEVRLPSDSFTENTVTGGATPTAWSSTIIPNILWLGPGEPGSIDDPKNDLVGLGFSISEPFRSKYYTQPTVANTNRYNIVDAYGSLSSAATGRDRMEEEHVRSSTIGANEKPLTQDGLVGSGTAAYYKSAFLQRLADPLREHDDLTNPYITVDWNMFDLKVYSGEHAGNTADPTNDKEEDKNYYQPPLEEGREVFASSQWGMNGIRLIGNRPLPNPWDRGVDVTNDIFDGQNKIELWNGNSIYTSGLGMTKAINLSDPLLLAGTVLPLPYQPSLTVPAVDTLAFDQFPVHSLGRLGTDPDLLHPGNVGTIIARTFAPMSLTQANFLGIDPAYIGAPVELIGIPSDTPSPEAVTANIATAGFQHLPWHNGPMANSYEVMQVPASSSGRFGVEFVDRKRAAGVLDTNYLLETDVLAAVGTPEDLPGSLGSNVRFGYLLNFQSAHGSWWGDWYQDNETAALVPPFVSLDLANFLNFVNVPSRFVGTRDWFQDNSGKYYSYSRFREPGKVNLNTLTESAFAALLENRTYNDVSNDPQGSYTEFDESRGNGGYYLFEAPYRGATSSLLTCDPIYKSSVSATLFRDDPTIPGVPSFAPAIIDATNSYTALEGIQRLSDMTTTRSNVFAVWLTLGYFEVEKIPTTGTFSPSLGITYDFANPGHRDRFKAIYPDGYMLKKEVGLETGEIKRHRAFYIIDRSVPFGYRRGQKLNSEDAILLKRFIE